MGGRLGDLWNQSTSIKILSKIHGKTQGSILEFLLLDTFKTTFLMENLFVMETIFSIFNEIRVGLPSPPLVAL